MNKIIATGHVMRCLAIADEFLFHGENSTFIVTDREAADFIEKKGYNTILLHSSYDELENELDELKEIISQYAIDRIIVDSYFVTERYFRELKGVTSVTYIDDMNAFFYDVDRIVAPGNWISRERYLDRYSGSGVKLLLGTAYVPLRKEFQNLSGNHNVIDVMITTGGTDTYEMARRLLDRISVTHSEWKVSAISSSQKVRDKYGNGNGNISVLSGISNMAEVMMGAKTAISASGTTLFELCVCGVPTVCFSFADNQLEFADTMGQEGIMEYVGDARYSDTIVEDIIEKIEFLMYNDGKRRELASRMSNLVDGRGTERIYKDIMGVN